MALVAYINKTKNPIYIGNKCIQPGGTRPVEESLIPLSQPQAVDQDPELEDAEATLLKQLLTGNVPYVLQGLQGLTDDELNQLKELEDEAEAPRKGVLEGILVETLKRSSELGEEG